MGWVPSQRDYEASENECDDDDHLQETKPELSLSKAAHVEGIDGNDGDAEHGDPYPDAEIRSPILNDQPGGGQIGRGRDDIFEKVVPTGSISNGTQESARRLSR